MNSILNKKIPNPLGVIDKYTFRKNVLSLFEIWKASGQQAPFLIILDEVDKLLPTINYTDSNKILSEYIILFRMLRGLAQSHRCLVVMVVAYRPDVNRRNVLGKKIGENPMFRSFQEEYLGFLTAEESQTLIREIGLWKKIFWTEEAMRRVYYYCGGHPLITRIFASHASREGSLKSIDLKRVEETAAEIKKEMRKNDIGNYYREGVWNTLYDNEKHVLASIYKKHSEGYDESKLAIKYDDALTNLEKFGLVTNDNGKLFVSSELFNVWMARRIT
ncbi:MAG: hypothetical protein GF353_00840 [Candidatus Lokiarchaeota archaeon]|nr:hypothetical protein [Candidatus Lokiarchaeota archaeon]